MCLSEAKVKGEAIELKSEHWTNRASNGKDELRLGTPGEFAEPFEVPFFSMT